MLTKKCKMLIANLIVLLLSACGEAGSDSDDEKDTGPVETGDEKYLMFFSGGFATCPTTGEFTEKGQIKISKWLDAALAIQPDSIWVMTCFSLTPGKLGWISSAGDRGEGDVLSIQQLVLERSTGKQVLLAGHSYGGWLALEVAKGLQARDQDPIGLITLDPISADTCKSNEAINEYLSSGKTPDDCRSAPPEPEITPADIRKGWQNYFQTNQELLHSGSMASASSNKDLAYPKGSVATNFEAHNKFLNDEALIAEALETWKNLDESTTE